MKTGQGLVQAWRRGWVLWVMLCLGYGVVSGYSGTVLSVTWGGPDYIINADADNASALYNRDRMSVNTQTLFTRVAGSNATQDFEFLYQLLDDDDNIVLLRNNAGNGVNFIVETRTINFGTGTVTSVDHFFRPRPHGALSQNRQYRLDVAVRVAGSSDLSMPRVSSGLRRYWHFTQTATGTARRNVLARITLIEFIRGHAIATGDSDNERGFLARAHVEIRRYDEWDAPRTEDDVEFRLTGRLNQILNKDESLVSLEGGGTSVQINHTYTLASFDNDPQVGIPMPHKTERFFDILFIPEEQLPTVTHQFFARADLLHREFPLLALVNTHLNVAGAAQPLLHFNGVLRTVDGARLIMQRFWDAPTSPVLGAQGNAWLTTISLNRGFLEVHPTISMPLALRTGIPINIALNEEGDAAFLGGELNLNIPANLRVASAPGNLIFERSALRMTVGGLRATVTLILPRGLGVASYNGTNHRIFLSKITRTDAFLFPEDLRPANESIFVPDGHYWRISEESKPFIVHAAQLRWFYAEGIIMPEPPPSGVARIEYVRHTEVAFLTAATALTPEQRQMKSNSGYYQHLSGTAADNQPFFTASEAGKALTQGTVFLNPGSVRTHFPLDANLSWAGTGTITYLNGLPLPVSQLLDSGPVTLAYNRNCGSDCGQLDPRLVTLNTAGVPLKITIDGGLQVAGTISANGNLQIGYIEALTPNVASPFFAHFTGSFTTGSFLSAGHHFAGVSALTNPLDAAGALLNSGIAASNPTVAERPGTSAYRDGLADYPGLNLRTVDEPNAVIGISVLGGEVSPVYNLSNRTKYYLRPSGVSGIHEPTANPFTDPLLIYDYLFEIDQFGLSLLSSQPFVSITRGSLFIPDPAVPSNGFTLHFNPLEFSCLGALTTATLASGPVDHTLSYWNADIRALSAAFMPKAGAACDPSEAFFTLGVRAHASNFTTPFYGTLVFYPNGDLVPGADPQAPEGFDSRLSPAAQLTFRGPGSENYTLTPLHAAYLNRHAEAGPGHNATG